MSELLHWQRRDLLWLGATTRGWRQKGFVATKAKGLSYREKIEVWTLLGRQHLRMTVWLCERVAFWVRRSKEGVVVEEGLKLPLRANQSDSAVLFPLRSRWGGVFVGFGVGGGWCVSVHLRAADLFRVGRVWDFVRGRTFWGPRAPGRDVGDRRQGQRSVCG